MNPWRVKQGVPYTVSSREEAMQPQQPRVHVEPRSRTSWWRHVRRECIDSDPLRRVVREAVRIEKYMKDPSVVLMNGKEEHFGPQMVRPSFGMDWMD